MTNRLCVVPAHAGRVAMGDTEVLTNRLCVVPAHTGRVAIGERQECELTVFVLSMPVQVEWLWERQEG